MQQASQTSETAMMRFAIRQVSRRLRARALKGCSFGALTGILFAVVHLLLEFLCLLLVHKGEPCKAICKLERMEERPVLIVVEWVVYFLVPNDSTIGTLRNVNGLVHPNSIHAILTDTSTILIQ